MEEAFRAHGDRIAAVIVEPVVGNMGCVPPLPGYLEALREITARHGALLIFDEVMTGFRVAFGGAQQRYGIRPDLTTLGKVIGGGLPVGAYGGRRDIMSQVAPAGPIYQAGTLSGNPLAVAAGLAMLRHLKAHPEIYKAAGAAGRRALRGGAAGSHGEPRGLHVHVLFHGAAGDRLRIRQTQRHRAVRPVLPRHAGARHLSGAFAVRSRLCFGRAHT